MADVAASSATLCEAYAGAARVVDAVQRGASLNEALINTSATHAVGPLRSAIRDLAHVTLRAYGLVHELIAALAHRPPADRLLLALLYVTVADLRNRRAKAFVAVDQAVRAVRLLDLHPASGMVNAVLRNYMRHADDLEARVATTPHGRWWHPDWWIEQLRASYPNDWESICVAGNAHPPLTLRVNRRRRSVPAMEHALAAAGLECRALGGDAIALAKPVPVAQIPGFEAGLVSVQDLGAQYAAPYLDVQPGQRVLDACAAPGGKACHVVEIADCQLVALDNDAARCTRIAQNLDRLGLQAQVVCGDATRPGPWWDGQPFDRVLLDAPCSASGIARRHPDIKWHRRAADLHQYSRTQAALLQALWPLLRPGGKLLYATCSVFAVENDERIAAFLGEQPQAVRLPLRDGHPAQLLPDPQHDGFFYALLEKR